MRGFLKKRRRMCPISALVARSVSFLLGTKEFFILRWSILNCSCTVEWYFSFKERVVSTVVNDKVGVMYVVVEFPNEHSDIPVAEVVPKKWLISNKQCRWPRKNVSANAKLRVDPKEDWSIHDVKIVDRSDAGKDCLC